MKKLVLLLFTVLCVYSCKNSTFTINGSVDRKELDGKTIFIKERIKREWKTIDSAKIENQKFSFKGTSDTAKIAFIVYEFPEHKRVRQAFVLEGGKITVSVDTANFMTIKGTSQNDLFQSYQDTKNAFNTKVESYYKSQKDILKTPEQKVIFDLEMEKFNKEEVSIDRKFATEHVNTLVGTHVFMNSFYGYSLSEKETVIGLMNADTKKVKRIQEIISDLDVEKKVAVGQNYSNIKLPSITGNELALSDLVGKTDFVLVDFWASWCGPCMEFLPELQAFYTKHKGTQFEIYGVSLDDSKEAWIDAVRSHKIEWKLVSDLQGWKCKGSRAYAVNSIPSTFLIDKKGKIVGKNLSLSEMGKYLDKKEDKK